MKVQSDRTFQYFTLFTTKTSHKRGTACHDERYQPTCPEIYKDSSSLFTARFKWFIGRDSWNMAWGIPRFKRNNDTLWNIKWMKMLRLWSTCGYTRGRPTHQKPTSVIQLEWKSIFGSLCFDTNIFLLLESGICSFNGCVHVFFLFHSWFIFFRCNSVL